MPAPGDRSVLAENDEGVALMERLFGYPERDVRILAGSVECDICHQADLVGPEKFGRQPGIAQVIRNIGTGDIVAQIILEGSQEVSRSGSCRSVGGRVGHAVHHAVAVNERELVVAGRMYRIAVGRRGYAGLSRRGIHRRQVERGGGGTLGRGGLQGVGMGVVRRCGVHLGIHVRRDGVVCTLLVEVAGETLGRGVRQPAGRFVIPVLDVVLRIVVLQFVGHDLLLEAAQAVAVAVERFAQVRGRAGFHHVALVVHRDAVEGADLILPFARDAERDVVLEAAGEGDPAARALELEGLGLERAALCMGRLHGDAHLAVVHRKGEDREGDGLALLDLDAGFAAEGQGDGLAGFVGIVSVLDAGLSALRDAHRGGELAGHGRFSVLQRNLAEPHIIVVAAVDLELEGRVHRCEREDHVAARRGRRHGVHVGVIHVRRDDPVLVHVARDPRLRGRKRHIECAEVIRQLAGALVQCEHPFRQVGGRRVHAEEPVGALAPHQAVGLAGILRAAVQDAGRLDGGIALHILTAARNAVHHIVGVAVPGVVCVGGLVAVDAHVVSDLPFDLLFLLARADRDLVAVHRLGRHHAVVPGRGGLEADVRS